MGSYKQGEGKADEYKKGEGGVQETGRRKPDVGLIE